MSKIEICKMENRNISSLFEHFERSMSSFGGNWYKSKSYFSFDKSGNLEIVHLNLIQRIVRQLFGLYPETHLRNVILNWNVYQSKHGLINSELNKKLSILWALHHSDSILIQPPEVFFFGNANIGDAEVIGVCQLFSDSTNSKFCGKILSENYRDGDIILVEGVDRGVRISPLQDMQTIQLPSSAEIYGWEPQGYSAYRDDLFETSINIENQFQINSSILLRLLNNVNFMTNPLEFQFKISGSHVLKALEEPVLSIESQFPGVEKEKLWEKLLNAAMENFYNSVKKIADRFVDKDKSFSLPGDSQFDAPSDRALQELQKYYLLFLQTPRDKEDCYIFIRELKKIYEQANKCLQKKKYTFNWTAEQNMFFQKTWAIRQESLCYEIERYRNLNKRVFVCAGSAHFFPNKGKGHSEVIAAMVKDKFCLAISNIEQNATYYSFEELSKKITQCKDVKA